MNITVTENQLLELGIDSNDITNLTTIINDCLNKANDAEQAWQQLSKTILTPYPFSLHLFIFQLLFPRWHDQPETAPCYIPTEKDCANANITHWMKKFGFNDVSTLHASTANEYQKFWPEIIKQLNILFHQEPAVVCDLTAGVERPRWLPGATINIVDSCLNHKSSSPALTFMEKDKWRTITYGELEKLVNRVATSLVSQHYSAGDAIGIAMPMNWYAIVIYLGIIKMGGIVVSIADSFSSQEIATRLRIANAKAIFTQDITLWNGKELALYEKVKAAIETCPAVSQIMVVNYQTDYHTALRPQDINWDKFLGKEDSFISAPCEPMSPCNILFSSGTTGDPKAIAWNHTTAIKAASDAYFHQNIQSHDVLAWPTNLGWMMGPWLIFAGLIHGACIALYTEVPKDKAFGEFIQNAKVTMLGVVPTLVNVWRHTKCMESLDWSHIKRFSSTGECSNPEDMLYLSYLANYRPIIEYCGGTEIGGAYISSTVIQKNYPSLFSTPTMGLNFEIIDEDGKAAGIGEVAIIPPSMGLSTILLNADHYHIYFENMPRSTEGKILRRHGDQIKRLPNGYYSVLGRVDDTMKLGGIKTSSAEIERVLSGCQDINEIAAIAASPPHNGPMQLIIYAATEKELDKEAVIKEMQTKINKQLNPLFKIHDLLFISNLPKTASNKIMRRVLRKEYEGDR